MARVMMAGYYPFGSVKHPTVRVCFYFAAAAAHYRDTFGEGEGVGLERYSRTWGESSQVEEMVAVHSLLFGHAGHRP